MPKMPKKPPRKINPYFSSRNGTENSSLGIAKELSALNATTTTVIGLTRFADTAASPMIRPPTMPMVPPSGPGIRTPASRISSNAISISKTPTAIEIRIEDNGKGFHVQNEAVDRQSTGTGLKVLNQTLLLLNAQNTVPITFQIQKSELGTDEYPGCQVKFTIPDHYSFTLPEGK